MICDGCINKHRCLDCKDGDLKLTEVKRGKHEPSFLNLPDDWNGERAEAFDAELIGRVSELLEHLDHQPEVFPVADGSVQIEYEKPTGEYLEFEFYCDNTVSLFSVGSTGEERTALFPFNEQAIQAEVTQFYG